MVYLCSNFEWWLIHLAGNEVSLPLNALEGYLVFAAILTYIQYIHPQATNINLTLICPLELHQPSPDTGYWLHMNAPKHS